MRINDRELAKQRKCMRCGGMYAINDFLASYERKSLPESCLDFCATCDSEYFDEYVPGPYSRYELALERTCVMCGRDFSIGDAWPDSEHYFLPPHDYHSGCDTHCLNCWLVGEPPSGSQDEDYADTSMAQADDEAEFEFPVRWTDDQIPSEAVNHLEPDELASQQPGGAASQWKLTLASDDGWPYDQIYEHMCAGDLLATYQWYFDQGKKLAVMPIGGLDVRRIVTFPRGYVFFPKGFLDLNQLNIVPNTDESEQVADRISAASMVTQNVFDRYALVAFPADMDWDAYRSANQVTHLEVLRTLGEFVERNCLNYARFRSCHLESVQGLSCYPGQVPGTDPGMAGLAVYDPQRHEGRIVAGAAYTHCVTRGLGMELRQFEWNELPQRGEVGAMVSQALALYSQLLESNSATSKFVQAMSLLEFLAYPEHMAIMKDVKTVIAKYLAPEGTERYKAILNRFMELTGKRDASVEKERGKIPARAFDGFRTRIVHLGQRLEQIVPSLRSRVALFAELDSYIEPVIRHMIEHSQMSFGEYADYRDHSFAHFNNQQDDTTNASDDDLPF